MGGDIIALQHRAESAGAKFVALKRGAELSRIVSADHELLVIAQGLLPDAGAALRLADRKGVLVFPADAAVDRGFERIDPTTAWAGILVTGGAAVEQLVQLPPDSDAPSALLRIAMQNGTPLRQVPPELIESGDWLIDPDREQIELREHNWIARHADPVSFAAPGLAVAERMGMRLARDVLGTALENAAWIGAAGLAILALLLGLFGMAGFGLGAATGAAICATMARLIDRVSAAGRSDPSGSPLARLIDFAIDPLLVALIALASPEDTGWLRLFVPVILIGLLQLAARKPPTHRWAAIYADRVLLAAILTPIAILGFAQGGAALLALLVLISLFFEMRPRD